RFNRELGKDVQQVAPETLELLRRHGWPGHIRELQSVLKQAILQAVGFTLLPDFLPVSLHRGSEDTVGPARSVCGVLESLVDDFDSVAELGQFIEAQLHAGAEALYEDTLRRMERLLLTRVLHHTGGNQLQAAKNLGITRGSLRTKLRDLGITICRTVATGEE